MSKIKFIFYLKGSDNKIIITDFDNEESLNDLSDRLYSILSTAKVFSFKTNKDTLIIRSSDILAIQVSDCNNFKNKKYVKPKISDNKNNNDDKEISEFLEGDDTNQSEYYIEDMLDLAIDPESEDEVNRMFYEEGTKVNDNSDSTSM